MDSANEDVGSSRSARPANGSRMQRTRTRKSARPARGGKRPLGTGNINLRRNKHWSW